MNLESCFIVLYFYLGLPFLRFYSCNVQRNLELLAAVKVLGMKFKKGKHHLIAKLQLKIKQ